MTDDSKKPRSKKSAASGPLSKPESPAEEKAEKKMESKAEDIIDKLLESQRLSEERMRAIIQSNQDQLAKTQQHLSAALEVALQGKSERKEEREIALLANQVSVLDRAPVNRRTEKLFAYCESSYVRFREEPIQDLEGPGKEKPRQF